MSRTNFSGPVDSTNGFEVAGTEVINSSGNYINKVTVLDATYTVTAAETGTTFILSDTTEFATTLPAPAAGLRYRFIVGAAPSGANYTVVTNGNATIIQGAVVVNGASVLGANEDTITFAASAAVVGDWVEVISDGTNWYVSGIGSAASSITLTDAA